MSRAFLDRTARLVSCILNLPVTLIACHLTPSGSRAGHASGVGAAPGRKFPCGRISLCGQPTRYEPRFATKPPVLDGLERKINQSSRQEGSDGRILLTLVPVIANHTQTRSSHAEDAVIRRKCRRVS